MSTVDNTVCKGKKDLRQIHCTYLGVSGHNFQTKILCVFFTEDFTLTNSVDPDEMQHYASFHLSLHCLQK